MAPEKTYVKMMENPLSASQIRRFLEGSGRNVTFSNAAKALPKHRNVRLIEKGDALVKTFFSI
ncbi:MAG: hypothetical protein IJS08_14560 [Victivallales bacterium]|nr:hypothetical protein [Victivallales bacterium]